MRRYLVFLIALAAAACSITGKYKSLPEVKAWDKDIKAFEQLDKSVSYSNEAVLFAGSSSIRLWNTLEKDMAPYRIIQRGYGGAKLSDFAVYAGRIFNPHQCSGIALFIANDITGSADDKSPEEVARLFRNILKTIRSVHKNTPVFWIEITPTPLRWKVWPQIQQANNLINHICETNKNSYFIKTANEFLDGSGLPDSSFFKQDKLHLTPKGYELWTKIIKNELKKVIPMTQPEIIGHRGSSFLAPENTVASANLAWELGAEAIETDIQLSEDKRIIVSHDSNTRRITGKKYQIDQTLSDTLRKLDAGSFKDAKYKGEKLPFLEEIIETVPQGKKLVIEIKCGSEVIGLLKKTIAKCGSGRIFDFISFDFQTIADAKKAFPDNSCYWLCSDTVLFNSYINKVQETGLNGVSLNYKILSKKKAEIVKKLGLGLYCWTVDDPDEARRLISLGVNGITTNRPDWMQKQLKDL